MAEKNYITPSGFQKLKAEYQDLLHKERPKIVEVVAWAASNGDRSENADYLYGKKRLREIDKRLKFLSDRLESAEVVDPLSLDSKKVVFGATVTIRDEKDQIKIYKIVGEDELDPQKGLISWRSPMAKSLLGKSVGDSILVRKPSGEEEILIEKIEFK